VVHADRIVPATIDFVDIAGLVRGAHKGEGLGNQFLAHIREVDAVAQVARCFEDANVVHVENRVDPVGDIATVTTELCLKDLDTVSKRADRARKLLKTNSPIEKLAGEICDGACQAPRRRQARRTFPAPGSRRRAGDRTRDAPPHRQAHVLHRQRRRGVAGSTGRQPALQALKQARRGGRPRRPHLRGARGSDRRARSRRPPEFLASAGLTEPGLHAVSRTGFELLGLITYFTAGKQEVRAWTIRGPKAPGRRA
jgi:ribosome-binding ATPase YchF (GTP1/OBG family)